MQKGRTPFDLAKEEGRALVCALLGDPAHLGAVVEKGKKKRVKENEIFEVAKKGDTARAQKLLNETYGVLYAMLVHIYCYLVPLYTISY